MNENLLIVSCIIILMYFIGAITICRLKINAEYVFCYLLTYLIIGFIALCGTLAFLAQFIE